MEILVIYFLLFIAIAVFFYYLYEWQRANFIKTFIDSQNTIMVLSSETKIKRINKFGLDSFGFNSLEAFFNDYGGLSDMFVVEEGCLDKHTYGKKWIKAVEKTKSKSAKVKIISKDKIELYYDIKVSKLKGSKEYLLIWNDISTLEREKSTFRNASEIDPLTQIYNRVKVNELFEKMFINANKYNQNLTVILFDIDHFKKINDTYGHNIGDKVLFELARLTQSLFRSNDTIARWGGEEFMIILENTTVKQGKMLANRVRVAIDKYNFTGVGDVTCSFGVTQYQSGETKIELLERVDDALYEAKDSGRNRVVIK